MVAGLRRELVSTGEGGRCLATRKHGHERSRHWQLLQPVLAIEVPRCLVGWFARQTREVER
eukprot:273960-Lingulodinium_polyedra.AAC.1